MRNILLIILIIPNLVFCQVNKENNGNSDSFKLNNFYRKIFNSYDTSFIKKASTDFVVILNNKNWMDVYQLKIADENLSLKSDLCYNIGASFGYKMFLIGYSFNINDLVSGEKIKRKEWNLNLGNNVLSLEMFYFNNKGQTKVSNYKNDTVSLSLNEPFEGLNTKIFGVDLYYFVNHKKYSNNAAYTDNHFYRQYKSAGSVILGFSFSHDDLYFDLSKLSNREQLAALKNTNVQDFVYNTYCLSIGYGYNFVFSKRWLANLTVIPSAGIKVDSNTKKETGYFTMKNKVRIALIQDLKKYFWGIKCQYNTHWYYTNDNSISNSIGNFNLLFGLKF